MLRNAKFLCEFGLVLFYKTYFVILRINAVIGEKFKKIYYAFNRALIDYMQ